MISRTRTEALVEPEMLRWARDTAGLSLEEASRSAQTSTKNIESWEKGEKRPSMPQLRKVAAAYKRLLSDFYLPTTPQEKPLPHDFRRLPGEGLFSYSRALRFQLRQARQRRALALDLATELEQSVPDLPTLKASADTEAVGQRVREVLHVSIDEQRTWRDPRKSYNSWRALIEAAGVLVFQVTGVAPGEMLGFSLPERPLPVIGVNRKMAPNGRTFTLMHELVHLLSDESSLCDIEESFVRPPEEQKSEVFCNAVAGAALVPREAFLSDPLVAPHRGPRDWSDEELLALARNFGVSQHVILRRLLTLNRTTQTFYASRQQIWKVYDPPAVIDPDEDFKRNMPQEVVSDLGRPFARLILDSYLNSSLSLSDASRYLGLRAEQVAKVRELVLGS
jgi:Zn-dependent peptidase ImmA (M78 family)/transcriptional regulator with XRE-family HTH domain